MCYKVVSENPFTLKYCFDRYKILEICNKAFNFFLPTLQFVHNWFVTNNMIKKLDDAVLSIDGKVFFNEDSINFTFYSGEICTLSLDINNMNLDDANFSEDNPETIVYVRLLDQYNRFKQGNAYR